MTFGTFGEFLVLAIFLLLFASFIFGKRIFLAALAILIFAGGFTIIGFFLSLGVYIFQLVFS